MNVNIVRGEPEQVTMHDVMHVIVLYMTQSVCMALTLNAYVCMSQLSEDVTASSVSYSHT